jgi:hypothetical protein
MLIKQDLSSKNIKGYQSSDLGISLSYSSSKHPLTEAVAEQQSGIRDAVYLVDTPSSYFNSGIINFESESSYFLNNYTAICPQFGELNEDFSVTRNGNGVACYIFDFGNVSKRIDVDLTSKSDGEQTQTWSGIQTGTLAEHMASGVDALINDSMTLNENAKVWSTFDIANENFVFNENNWLISGGVDLTCYAANPSNGKARALITPRHMIGTEHLNYQIPIGGDAWFVDNSNILYKRTVLDKEIITTVPDAVIYVLNEDLPESITPCKIADNIDNYTKELNNRWPVIATNQDGMTLIRESYRRINVFFTEGYNQPTENSARIALTKNMRGGDSGGPVFVLVNGELCLISAHTSSVGGTSYSRYISQINSAISSINSANGIIESYSLTVADFSEFPTFNGVSVNAS